MMNKKIKFYAIVLAVVYVCLMVSSIIDGIDPFLAGRRDTRDSKIEHNLLGTSICYVNVKPIDGRYSFSDSISIGDNAVSSPSELNKLIVQKSITKDNISPLYIAYVIVRVLIVLVTLGAIFYIPFLFFRIVNAVRKGEMYDPMVLKRLRRMGRIVIGYYCISLFYAIGETYFNMQLIQIEGYRIIFSMPNFTPLILGLVILFLAEVLRVGLFMKEEQDLTI